MRKWNISSNVILLPIVLLLLSFTGTATVERKPSAPAGLQGIVDAAQAPELIIPRVCLADKADLSADFEMHIPVNEKGELQLDKKYFTGGYVIHPKPGASFKSCAIWRIKKSHADGDSGEQR